MLIKSLKMENFSQFKGITKIEFSTDPSQNVTIILGDNTYGKTTLLQAFNWCLYGTVVFPYNPDFLLNLEVANDMLNGDTKEVGVEIVLLHDNTEYVITRTQRYHMNHDKVAGEKTPLPKVSYKQPDGQMESVKAIDVKNVINNILPEELSTFFFFDTERVNSITKRKDVTDAVKGLLGLAAIDSAIKHLGNRASKSTVIGSLYAGLDLSRGGEAENALRLMQAAEDKRQSIKEQSDECGSQISHYEARKEQLDIILRDNQETSRLQKRKEELEKAIAQEQKHVNSSVDSFFKSFSKNSLPFFVQPLIKTASNYLKEVKIDDKGIKDLTRSTIMELLERGRCICGAELCDGNEAYLHLIEELKYVPPESIGNTVRHYRELLEAFSRPAEDGYDSLQEKYQEILRSQNRIQDWEDEIVSVSQTIQGKENMSQYEAEIVDIKKRLRDLHKKKDELIRSDEALKRDIEHYKKYIDSLSATTGKNKEIMGYISYAEEIYSWLSDFYTVKEKSIREDLELEVNEIFDKMYHGKRRVAIDSKYNVSLMTTISDNEIAAGESEGSNRVKNFAFIAGLVNLAKKRIIDQGSEGDFDLSSEPYPLVMDAPFSNADEIHTENISKILPEVAEQVIMFVMQKDWNYAERVMAHRVGKQYILNKVSETWTELK